MMKAKLTPRRRFPEFNEAWAKSNLASLFEITAGGDIEKGNVSPIRSKEFIYPIYANAEKEKGLYGYSNIYKVDGGVVTIAGRGVNIGIAHARDHRFYPIVRLLVLKPRNNVDIKFFEYSINRLSIFVESTGVPQLTIPQVSNYNIHYPIFQEQKKIASFLSAVDSKIQQLNKKKEVLEQYKKGVMQKLFKQEIRFRDEKGKIYPKWEKKRLLEVSEINPRTEELPASFVYIDLESVEKGVLKYERQIQLNEAPSRAQRVLANGDILFQCVRPYQMNNLLFNFGSGYVASTGYAQIRTNQNPAFIFQFLHTDSFVNEAVSRCTGTSFPAISSSDLGQIKVPVPSRQEQEKIVSFLQRLDERAKLLSKQIELTTEFKKGLLQQMFV